MTNIDRLIEALRGIAPDAVHRYVEKYVTCPYPYENKGFCLDEASEERNSDDMCIACKEDWLLQELEFEMEGLKIENIGTDNEKKSNDFTADERSN